MADKNKQENPELEATNDLIPLSEELLPSVLPVLTNKTSIEDRKSEQSKLNDMQKDL